MRGLRSAISLGAWLCVALLVAVAPAAAQQSQARLTIWMALVTSPDPNAANGLKQWHQLLSNSLPAVVRRTVGTASFLDRLQIESSDVPNPPNDATLRTRWDERQALQAMSAVSSFDSKATIIDSRIYLGALKGDLQSDWLQIKQRVVTSEFSVAGDSIALVILYALAMDAKRQNRGAAIVCGFLTEARSILGELARAKSEPQEMRAAIDQSLRGNSCGPRP